MSSPRTVHVGHDFSLDIRISAARIAAEPVGHRGGVDNLSERFSAQLIGAQRSAGDYLFEFRLNKQNRITEQKQWALISSIVRSINSFTSFSLLLFPFI